MWNSDWDPNEQEMLQYTDEGLNKVYEAVQDQNLLNAVDTLFEQDTHYSGVIEEMTPEEKRICKGFILIKLWNQRFSKTKQKDYIRSLKMSNCVKPLNKPNDDDNSEDEGTKTYPGQEQIMKCKLYFRSTWYSSINSQDFLVLWPEFSGIVSYWDKDKSKAITFIIITRTSVYNRDDYTEGRRIIWSSCDLCINSFLNGDINSFAMEYLYTKKGLIALNPGGFCKVYAINTALRYLGCRPMDLEDIRVFYKKSKAKRYNLFFRHFTIKEKHKVSATNLNDLLKDAKTKFASKHLIISGEVISSNKTDGRYYNFVAGHALYYNVDTGMIKDCNLYQNTGVTCPLYEELPNSGSIEDYFKRNIRKFGAWIQETIFGKRTIDLVNEYYYVLEISCVNPDPMKIEAFEGYKDTREEMLNKRRARDYQGYVEKEHDRIFDKFIPKKRYVQHLEDDHRVWYERKGKAFHPKRRYYDEHIPLAPKRTGWGKRFHGVNYDPNNPDSKYDEDEEDEVVEGE